ncbi:alpha/beta fold hydrolase [Variovorax ginsengisoli]|uniref:Alpha/beta hydrolase n=1 Tax=Variovorax ginsengisoli TaxID=363844 RepID=A0ABT8SCB9_9BURK|nr:alpha/beta hydrolase [Variovorax ginsengisoli]MDN8616769.1 alpha/beta hydrolase [Variovorax ginsengisoli]MDO1535939.1 alpha/beta hydrolase [Variovorax ginsengisoli]
MDDYNETPVQFGPDGSLIGIITTPGDGPMAPVGCILMNMGAIHRIGPRRTNVKLARQMAACGISSIRMDLAGLGDSRPAGETVDFRMQAVLDVQAAMNLVGTMLGVHRFILVGLCSGARNGLCVAVNDPRLVGLLMFDGPGFPGRRARWERSARRALADPSLSAFFARVSGAIRRKLLPSQPAADANIFESEAPEDTVEYFGHSIRQLVERGVATMLVYTGSVHVKDRNFDQLGPFANEPFVRQLEYRFIPEIDHGLISQASQQAFMKQACDWILRVIHGDGSPASPALSAVGQSARGARATSSLATKLEHAGS